MDENKPMTEPNTKHSSRFLMISLSSMNRLLLFYLTNAFGVGERFRLHAIHRKAGNRKGDFFHAVSPRKTSGGSSRLSKTVSVFGME
jgi:hypothetical protein